MIKAAAKKERQAAPTPRPEVRHAVRDLLVKSKAFAQLPQEKQRQIAHDMAEIGDYLAAPEGILANTLPPATGPVGQATNLARSLDDSQGDASDGTYASRAAQVNKIGQSKFQAQAAREGAAVAGLLLQKVNFPTFVANLIQGVFHAIVQASMEQMEAYSKLVASVAQTLSQFRDENVSENQGRDHLVDQFPDLFQIGTDSDPDTGQTRPRVQTRGDVDEDTALKRVNDRLPMADGKPLDSLDLSDEDTEQKLMTAARNQLAASRQQLLATMVLMGINRIVVTDGKISAKIMYDFQARDTRKMQRSAAAFDYAKTKDGQLQTVRSGEGTQEVNQEGGEESRSDDKDSHEEDRRDGSYYSKGTYKYSDQPIMTAMSTASESTDAALQTRAQLAGVVDVNFKSDYFPLEKMADSFQIANLQAAAQPGRGAARGAGQAAAGGGAPQPTAAGSTATAPATATPPPAHAGA
jgi:hypothetical protein